MIIAGIVFEAYAPLGSPGTMSRDDPVVMEDPVINEIAEKHCATPGQVELELQLKVDIIFLSSQIRSVSPSCCILVQ